MKPFETKHSVTIRNNISLTIFHLRIAAIWKWKSTCISPTTLLQTFNQLIDVFFVSKGCCSSEAVEWKRSRRQKLYGNCACIGWKREFTIKARSPYPIYRLSEFCYYEDHNLIPKVILVKQDCGSVIFPWLYFALYSEVCFLHLNKHVLLVLPSALIQTSCIVNLH